MGRLEAEQQRHWVTRGEVIPVCRPGLVASDSSNDRRELSTMFVDWVG